MHDFKKLDKIYQTLSLFEQALVQLCSIIYEPTTRLHVWNCWQSTGLFLSADNISRGSDLMPYLTRLKNLNLINDKHQCHEHFLETASRYALSSGLMPEIFKNRLREIDVESNWFKSSSSLKASCFACHRKMLDLYVDIQGKKICCDCVLYELKQTAAKEDITARPLSELFRGLCLDSDLCLKIMFLWRFKDVFKVIEERAPSRIKELMGLLIHHLSYEGPHPLAYSVQQAAFNACVSVGKIILPFLLEMNSDESWQFFVNVTVAAASIAPDDGNIRDLVEKAILHPLPEAKTRLLHGLKTINNIWMQNIYSRHQPQVEANSSRAKCKTFDFTDFYGQTHYIAPTCHFRTMSQGVRKTLPLHDKALKDASVSFRLMRDYRIGFYQNDETLYDACYQELGNARNGWFKNRDPLVQVFMNPFYVESFRTLPAGKQVFILSKIFSNTIEYLDADEDALAFALSKNYFASLPQSDQEQLFDILSTRLILGGKIIEANKLLTILGKDAYSYGHRGWLYFVKGKYDQAIAAFETDKRLSKKKYNNPNFFSDRITWPFYILALLQHYLDNENDSNLKRIQHAIKLGLNSFQSPYYLRATYTSLEAILYDINQEKSAAIKTLTDNHTYENCIAVYFSVFAEFWVTQQVDQARNDLLSKIFRKTKSTDLSWLAMEYAELLCCVERPVPIRRNYADKIQEMKGLKSIISILPAPSSWQSCLADLYKVTTLKESQGKRMIWLVEYNDFKISLQAVEQKRNADGLWSKGVKKNLEAMFDYNQFDYLTSQDQMICATIKKNSSVYRETLFHYSFEWQHTLPLLIGHPLIFLAESPSMPVELLKGDLGIVVKTSKDSYQFSIMPEVPQRPYVVVREKANRFKVIRLSALQQQITKIIGKQGLTVPKSAKPEVEAIIPGLASIATLHSGLNDQIQNIEIRDAETTLHVQLRPEGTGLNVSCLVKPFADDGDEGPYLVPGEGEKYCITNIKGKKVQVERNLKQEIAQVLRLEDQCESLVGLSQNSYEQVISDTEMCLETLLNLKSLHKKKQIVVEWPEGEKWKVARLSSHSKFDIHAQAGMDWFEINGTIALDDGLVIEMKSLLEQLPHAFGRFIPLEDGQFIILTRELAKRVEKMAGFCRVKGKHLRMHRTALLSMDHAVDPLPGFKVDSHWVEWVKRIETGRNFIPRVPSDFKGKLRSYQVDGYEWLSRLAYWGMGACLADDMGLGKTIQSLAALLDRAAKGPAFVVAPTSVCYNWISEIKRFAPSLNPIQFPSRNRKMLVQQLQPKDVLITSYNLMQLEVDILSSVTFSTIILDEAQMIKNYLSKRSKAAMKLKGDFKIVTTGTPLENHLGELYNLFRFINPNLLGARKKFTADFASPIERSNDQNAKQKLKQLIQPFILRRLKSEVLSELPPRTDILLRIEMNAKEAAFYEALRQDAMEKISEIRDSERDGSLIILAEIMRLRRACCNPRLIDPKVTIDSSKLDMFEQLVVDLLENRHKILVFSQFVDHLSLIRKSLESQNIQYFYLDGSTPVVERQMLVDAFQSGERDVFLISLKAGGLGLNLTAANYVIHMDPWWNPAVEDQASDRAHRIGQTQPVTVYRLVTKGTIEEKIVKLHDQKRDLADSLLEGSDVTGKISAQELLRLIKDQGFDATGLL